MFTFSPPIGHQGRDRWITLSYVVFEAVASVAMTIIVVLLLLFRRSELCEVRRLLNSSDWEKLNANVAGSLWF